MMITGDTMARPLIETLQANRDPYDVSSLFSLSSDAAVFSPVGEGPVLRGLPRPGRDRRDRGVRERQQRPRRRGQGQHRHEGRPDGVRGPDSASIDEDFTRPAGLRRRRQGRPLRQHPDRLLQRRGQDGRDLRHGADGTRYAVPGDFATVEEDGSITLLGRGSVSINSGGEKIYPEEVEAAVKSHAAVYDATVIGVNDERWGQRVAAVVQLRDGGRLAYIKDLQEHCRKRDRRLQGPPPGPLRRRGDPGRPAASPTTGGPPRSPPATPS